jgi:hypothetical protein
MEHYLSTKGLRGVWGFGVLEFMNKCLLSKWLYKLLTRQGVWQGLLENKYLHFKSLSQAKDENVPNHPFERVL